MMPPPIPPQGGGRANASGPPPTATTGQTPVARRTRAGQRSRIPPPQHQHHQQQPPPMAAFSSSSSARHGHGHANHNQPPPPRSTTNTTAATAAPLPPSVVPSMNSSLVVDDAIAKRRAELRRLQQNRNSGGGGLSSSGVGMMHHRTTATAAAVGGPPIDGNSSNSGGSGMVISPRTLARSKLGGGRPPIPIAGTSASAFSAGGGAAGTLTPILTTSSTIKLATPSTAAITRRLDASYDGPPSHNNNTASTATTMMSLSRASLQYQQAPPQAAATSGSSSGGGGGGGGPNALNGNMKRTSEIYPKGKSMNMNMNPRQQQQQKKPSLFSPSGPTRSSTTTTTAPPIVVQQPVPSSPIVVQQPVTSSIKGTNSFGSYHSSTTTTAPKSPFGQARAMAQRVVVGGKGGVPPILPSMVPPLMMEPNFVGGVGCTSNTTGTAAGAAAGRSTTGTSRRIISTAGIGSATISMPLKQQTSSTTNTIGDVDKLKPPAAATTMMQQTSTGGEGMIDSGKSTPVHSNNTIEDVDIAASLKVLESTTSSTKKPLASSSSGVAGVDKKKKQKSSSYCPSEEDKAPPASSPNMTRLQLDLERMEREKAEALEQVSKLRSLLESNKQQTQAGARQGLSTNKESNGGGTVSLDQFQQMVATRGESAAVAWISKRLENQPANSSPVLLSPRGRSIRSSTNQQTDLLSSVIPPLTPRSRPGSRAASPERGGGGGLLLSQSLGQALDKLGGGSSDNDNPVRGKRMMTPLPKQLGTPQVRGGGVNARMDSSGGAGGYSSTEETTVEVEYLIKAANSIPNEYGTQLASYIVRTPYGATSRAGGSNIDKSFMFGSYSHFSPIDTYNSHASAFDPNSLEILAFIEADGSVFTLTLTSDARHGKVLRNCTDDGEMDLTENALDWAIFDNVEERERSLGRVTYIDVEGNERDYWLDSIYEEALTTRESYCMAMISAGFALKSVTGLATQQQPMQNASPFMAAPQQMMHTGSPMMQSQQQQQPMMGQSAPSPMMQPMQPSQQNMSPGFAPMQPPMMQPGQPPMESQSLMPPVGGMSPTQMHQGPPMGHRDMPPSQPSGMQQAEPSALSQGSGPGPAEPKQQQRVAEQPKSQTPKAKEGSEPKTKPDQKPKQQQQPEEEPYEPADSALSHMVTSLFSLFFSIFFLFTIKIPFKIGSTIFTFWVVLVALRILWLLLADDGGAWEMGAGVDYEYNMPGIY